MSSFRFRKKTEYGLMMMALLVKTGQGGIVSVHSMEEQGLPRSFLVKIARSLVKAKLIIAKEGRGGGYSLRRDPDQINLADVITALEGDIATVACLVHGAKRCPLADMCPHRNMMSRLTDEVNAIFSKYTLGEFVN